MGAKEIIFTIIRIIFFSLILECLLSFTVTELVLGNIVDASVELGIKKSSRIFYIGFDSNGEKTSDIEIGDDDYKEFSKDWTRLIMLILLPIPIFLSYRISFSRLYRFLRRKNRVEISFLDLLVIRITTVIILWVISYLVTIFLLLVLEAIISFIVVSVLFLLKNPHTAKVADFTLKLQYDYINHNINGIVGTLANIITFVVLTLLSFKGKLPWCNEANYKEVKNLEKIMSGVAKIKN